MRHRLRQQSRNAVAAVLEGLVNGALKEASRRQKKRDKAELRRARQVGQHLDREEKEEEVEGPSRLKTPESARISPSLITTPMTHDNRSSASRRELLPRSDGPIGSIADWMSAAVSSLLGEMETSQQQLSDGERASRRLLAIEAAERERTRRLAELQEELKEEEARRSVMRSAAAAAAEGERRRRIQILRLEGEEERRMRQRQQQMAIELMEAERERRVSLQLASDSSAEDERLVRQLQARKALELERLRRVRVLRLIEEQSCTVRQEQRARAVSDMEAERQRRLINIAAGTYELAVGVAKPEGEPSVPSDVSDSRQRQWAAFASGVAARLGEEEQAERSKRRQWAAAAAQLEQDRAGVLRQLGPEIERWAALEHLRLGPLQSHVWRVLRLVANEVQALWGGSVQVELFGSWASGLQLASSDVDLLVCGAPLDLSAPGALRALAESLTERCQSWLTCIKLVDTARVPVIKAAAVLPASVAEVLGPTSSHELQIDISLEVSSHSGRASTKLTRDVFCAHLPGLRPLVLVIKAMLTGVGLNSAASGGLGSYALVLMATALLQLEASSPSSPSQGIGHLLVMFLEYFSALPESPDALHAVVLDSASRLQPKRVRRGKRLSSREADGAREANASHVPSAGTVTGTGSSMEEDARYEEALYASSILVQDPLEAQFSNVGATTFRWGQVQRLFRDALHRLQAAIEAETPMQPDRLLAELLVWRAG